MSNITAPTTPVAPTQNISKRPRAPPPQSFDELMRRLNKDAAYAIQRHITGWCQYTDDPKTPAEKRNSCTHETCWKLARLEDTRAQTELCELTGVPIQGIFNPRANNMITFRTA